MKKITILLLFFCMTSPTWGAVSTRVCEADGNTPFDGRDIMVGTRLTIIVRSDVGEPWGTMVAVCYWRNNIGIMEFCRPEDHRLMQDWTGSHFPAAGNKAVVWDWEESGITVLFYVFGV